MFFQKITELNDKLESLEDKVRRLDDAVNGSLYFNGSGSQGLYRDHLDTEAKVKYLEKELVRLYEYLELERVSTKVIAPTFKKKEKS